MKYELDVGNRPNHSDEDSGIPSGLFYAFVRCSDGNLQATAGDGRMELAKEEVIDLLVVAKRLEDCDGSVITFA